MASIHKEMLVEAALEEVWADREGYLFALCASRALRLIRSQRALLPRRPRVIHDVGAIHTRLARQFVVDGMMDQGCAAMRRTLEADNGDDERIN